MISIFICIYIAICNNNYCIRSPGTYTSFFTGNIASCFNISTILGKNTFSVGFYISFNHNITCISVYAAYCVWPLVFNVSSFRCDASVYHYITVIYCNNAVCICRYNIFINRKFLSVSCHRIVGINCDSRHRHAKDQ